MPSADRLFVNGTVLTVDGDNRVARAVAVRGERILAVGAEADVRAAASGDAQIVDLGGGTLVPGFVDAHSHVGFVGDLRAFYVDLASPPVGKMTKHDDVIAALAERAKAVAPGEWIVGTGYDDTLLAEKLHPTRRELDRASAEHPILTLHVSGHLAAVNSLALERAGIDRSTPQPEGGVIRIGEDGEPDGVLEEPAAFGRIYPLLPAPPPEARIDSLEGAARHYASLGVTTAQDGAAELARIRDLATAARAGRLPVRVVAWPSYVAWQKLQSGELRLDGIPEERLWLGAVKFFADGSIQGYTGHLCDPYHVPRTDDANYRGYATLTRETLSQQVAEAHAAGWQIAVHANGDAAIDDFLAAVAHAQAKAPRPDARPIAVHAQMTREDQLDRMRELGVVPSFFVLHTYYWGDRHRDIFLGPERAARISPTRSAADRGLRFTIHTDAPVVPMDPLLLMWSAVNRRTTSGEVLGPEQRLTPTEALRAVTIDSAYQLRRENALGSIEPGKLADFALLSANPLDVPETIRDIRVERSWVGGAPVA